MFKRLILFCLALFQIYSGLFGYTYKKVARPDPEIKLEDENKQNGREWTRRIKEIEKALNAIKEKLKDPKNDINKELDPCVLDSLKKFYGRNRGRTVKR